MTTKALIYVVFAALAFPMGALCASGQPSGLTLVWTTKPVEGTVETVRVATSGGSVWVAGNVGAEFATDVFVSRLDGAGKGVSNVVWTTRLAGSRADLAKALAVDAAGNAYVAGSTQSTDFPVKGAYQPFWVAPASSMGFVTKLDPQGRVVYSTLLGGDSTNQVDAIAVDSSGSVVAGGTTTSPNFPTTPGAPITTFPISTFGRPAFGFVARLSPQGNQLVSSTLLGGARRYCSGGSNCLGAVGGTSVLGIALDAQGNAWVTGGTSAVDFPTTDDAFQKSIAWNYPPGSKTFFTKVNVSGTAFVYSSYLAGSSYGYDIPAAIALGPAGEIYVTGASSSPKFPTTPDALEPSNPQGEPRGYISIFADAGRQLKYSTYFDPVAAAQLESDGRLWLSGASGPDYLAVFDPATGKVVFQRSLAPGLGGGSLAVAGLGVVLAGGASGSVTALDTASDGPPAVVGVTSAAGGSYRPAISPGELVTVFGVNIDGYRVFVDGILAPLLYSDARQINAVVPYGIARHTTVQLELVQDAAAVASLPVRSVDAQPEIFQPVLNQDYSVNSYANPAQPGDIVMFWATGAGDMTPPLADGQVIAAPYPVPATPITVELNGKPVEALYAGGAPGMIAGVLQFNVRLPQDFTYPYELTLRSGSYRSQPVTVVSASVPQ